MFELVDGGDKNIYILTIEEILNDLANQPDPQTQAIAIAQTLAILGALGTGYTGSSCDAAAVSLMIWLYLMIYQSYSMHS